MRKPRNQVHLNQSNVYCDQVRRSTVDRTIIVSGELLFIPSGWWHTALNLEESIAVTQNFVSTQNLPSVVQFLKSKENPQLWNCFQRMMNQRFPEQLREAEQKIVAKNTKKPT